MNPEIARIVLLNLLLRHRGGAVPAPAHNIPVVRDRGVGIPLPVNAPVVRDRGVGLPAPPINPGLLAWLQLPGFYESAFTTDGKGPQ